MNKKLFTMNEEQWKTMMAAMESAANQRVMYASGGVQMFEEPQEIANRAWKKLGAEMGFVWDTASAADEERSFMAIPVSASESMAATYNPPFRFNGD